MSVEPVVDAPPAAMPGKTERGTDGHNDRSLGEIREGFGSTVSDLKQRYGLLLEQRDRQIKDLTTKLIQGPPEKPKRRVLVVDDARSTAEIVSHYLEGHAVEVIQIAASGTAEAIIADEYDAMMIEAACVVEPGVDGAGLCRRLCAQENHKTLILTSSRPGDKVKNDAEKAGARFLRKPFRRAQLLELIRETLLKETR